ncbi:MAG: GspE/PulE family protein [Kiritimatiellia bacterium]|nr:GspE/PulE family protein [Kiritimatiellia bacterium]MDP6847785.1 GspE/PulE family protein [Kiritimatiellia bacterium]
MHKEKTEKSNGTPDNSLFLESLVEKKVITKDAGRELTLRFQGDAFAMLLHLLSRKPDSRNKLGKLWGDFLNVAYINTSHINIHYELVQKLPEAFAKSRRVMPLYDFGGAVTLATPAPADRELISEVEGYLDAFVSPVFAFPDQVDTALEIAYQTDSSLTKLLSEFSPGQGKTTETVSAAELRKLSKDQAIIAFTQGLLFLAVRRRASDIHIEPEEDTLRIRFRVDGVLQTILRMESGLLPPLVTRLKVMAEVDISESRQPQDGRIELPSFGDPLLFRFSTVPTIHGEKAVLRLMGHTEFQDVPDLADLGFSADIAADINRVVGIPNGIFFVTGPTGSGKTTTLYSILKYLNDPGVNIMTIENPVEFPLQGVNQVQVQSKIGITFGSVLRHFLRQDPDIILLGEIRDLETARIAAQAALTGHLVLTTMHTNDVFQAVTRLLDLGVDPTLVAPCTIGVMAQRLVRRLCESCKEEYELPPEQADLLFEKAPEDRVFMHRAVGCESCDKSGYRGRLAIHEMYVMEPEVRALIARNAPYGQLVRCAESHNFTSLRYDGLKKVLRGLTTLEEVDRVTLTE